jgi:hypothetical protein
MKYTSTSLLPRAYGEFLEKTSWTYYCTLTTSYSLTLNSARKSVERLHESLTCTFRIDNEIFWIAEPFDSKYGYHLHALIKLNCLNPLDQKNTLNKAWQHVTRGSYGKAYNRSIFAPYKPNTGGNFYVSKFVGRNDIEYGFL